MIDGPVVFGAIAETDAGKAIQALLRDIRAVQYGTEGVASSTIRPKALVFDATGATSTAELTSLQRSSPCCPPARPGGRVIVVGRTPEPRSPPQHIAQRALEALREVSARRSSAAPRSASYVAPDAHEQLDSTLRFFPPPSRRTSTARSPGSGPSAGQQRPGSAARRSASPRHRRGARHRRGDRRHAGPGRRHDHRRRCTAERGRAAQGDLEARRQRTPPRRHRGRRGAADRGACAGARRARHRRPQRRHHRDKRLANMRTDVGRRARREPACAGADHEHLVESGAIRDGGSIVGVASIAGIAGNNGWRNYATSKAGVIGLVQALRQLRSGRSRSTRSRRASSRPR